MQTTEAVEVILVQKKLTGLLFRLRFFAFGFKKTFLSLVHG